jgi:hypothetical protein
MSQPRNANAGLEPGDARRRRITASIIAHSPEVNGGHFYSPDTLGTVLWIIRLLRSPLLVNLMTRHCVACRVPVSNSNLGGWDGRSALTGDLYCLRCADYERGQPQ